MSRMYGRFHGTDWRFWGVILGAVVFLLVVFVIAAYAGEADREECQQRGREYHCVKSSGWVGGKYATWETCDCVVRP